MVDTHRNPGRFPDEYNCPMRAGLEVCSFAGYVMTKVNSAMTLFYQCFRPYQWHVVRNVHQINLQSFKEDYTSSHIATNQFQKSFLTIGASIFSLLDPTRGDMIATLGETSGENALRHMKNKMEESEEGRSILKDMPRINSKTVDLDYLGKLPENTVGYTYYKFLDKNKVTPDTRLTVQFVDDFEMAYVMQRYREVHDLIHAMLGMPTNMLGEVTVKWVEGIQTRLPMCIGGGLLGAVRLSPKQRQKYVTTHLPWAIQTGMTSKFLLSCYYEKRWEQPLTELHKDFKITPLQVKKNKPKELNEK